MFSIVNFLLALALYFWRVDAIDSDGYFLADDGMKAGKVEGDGIPVIVADVIGVNSPSATPDEITAIALIVSSSAPLQEGVAQVPAPRPLSFAQVYSNYYGQW